MAADEELDYLSVYLLKEPGWRYKDAKLLLIVSLAFLFASWKNDLSTKCDVCSVKKLSLVSNMNPEDDSRGKKTHISNKLQH